MLRRSALALLRTAHVQNLCPYSAAATSTTTATPNPLDSFVDSLNVVGAASASYSSSQLRLNTIKDVAQFLSQKSRLDGSEVLGVLQTSLRLQKSQIVPLLSEYQSVISTAIPTLSESGVVEAIRAVVRLGVEDRELMLQLLKRFDQVIETNLDSVSADLLEQFLPLLPRISKLLSDEQTERLNNVIVLRTKDITKTGQLLTFYAYSPINSLNWKNEIEAKASDLLPVMNLGELVSFVHHSARRQSRNISLLRPIAHHINLKKSLTLNQLKTLAHSCGKLSFYDARILKKLAADLVVNVNLLENWSDAASVADSFTRLRIRSPAAWSSLVQWCTVQCKSSKPPFLSLSIVVTALATVGHKDAQNLPQTLATMMKPELAGSEQHWLNCVHSLAFFEALTEPLAESVLREEFVTNLLSGVKMNPGAMMHLIQKLLHIDAYTGAHLKEYRGRRLDIDTIRKLFTSDKEISELALLIKHGKTSTATKALELIYKFAPMVSHCKAPRVWMCPPTPSIGCLVEAEVRMNEETKKADPLVKEGSGRPVLLFGWNHFNRDEEGGNTRERLLGVHDLTLRLLEQFGQNPVLISLAELGSLPSQLEQIAYLKKKLSESN